MENLYKVMVQYREIIKLFHFQSLTFAQHKTSDMLLEKYDDLFDKFWEVYQGINGRINIKSFIITIGKSKDTIHETNNLINHINMFDFNNHTDLQNIRDDLLSILHQYLYLLTFK